MSIMFRVVYETIATSQIFNDDVRLLFAYIQHDILGNVQWPSDVPHLRELILETYESVRIKHVPLPSVRKFPSVRLYTLQTRIKLFTVHHPSKLQLKVFGLLVYYAKEAGCMYT